MIDQTWRPEKSTAAPFGAPRTPFIATLLFLQRRGFLLVGRENSTLLPPYVNFLPIHQDLARRLDADLDATRRDREHGDADFAADDDGLVETPGENQHA